MCNCKCTLHVTECNIKYHVHTLTAVVSLPQLKVTIAEDGESFNCLDALKRIKAMLKVYQGADMIYDDIRSNNRHEFSWTRKRVDETAIWLSKTLMQLSPDDQERVLMALETGKSLV